MSSQLPVPASTRRVLLAATIARIHVLVDAVMAPAEPEVGINVPYPVQMDVVRAEGGAFFPLSDAEHRLVVRALQDRYYALESADVPAG